MGFKDFEERFKDFEEESEELEAEFKKKFEELEEIYTEYFIDAYKDLICVVKTIPVVIVIEVESAFSHLMKFCLRNDSKSNLEKAEGHIYRATLDCYKLLQQELSKNIKIIDLHRSAFKGCESNLLNDLETWNAAILGARKYESEAIGGNKHILTLQKWRDTISLSKEIYDNIDGKKLRRSKIKNWFRIPSYLGFSLFIVLFSSYLVNILT